MKDGYFLMSWPALAMVSISGNGGGDIKFIGNTFNGDVNTTKKTQYAISGGGDLQNFEWMCNEFNDFETAVTYNGTGPAQNPNSGIFTLNIGSNMNLTDVTVNVTDQFGRVVFETVPTSYNQQIHLVQPAGVYIVRIKEHKTLKSRTKLIITKQ